MPYWVPSYEPFITYGVSKLANLITARELQRRFDRWAKSRYRISPSHV